MEKTGDRCMRGDTEMHINPQLHKLRQVYMLPTTQWIGIIVSKKAK